ncbi:MAG: DNA-binding domain-containing protein [Methyloligellaceae bacterium]
MGWQNLQEEFVRSLKQPDLPVPDEIGKTLGEPSRKRFNVYRNNSAVGISEALMAGFPVVAQLVGEEFFKAMASVYMQSNLPASPVMMRFGDNFPEFIANFEPAQSVPYLADIARLEWAWTGAYHAADADPIGIEALGQIDPEMLHEVKFSLHPSLHLMKSEWPVFSIWSAHQQENTSDIMERLEFKPEQGLIVRPHLDVEVMVLMDLAYGFIYHISRGKNLGNAFSQLGTENPDDLSGCLQLLFNSGSIISVQ